MSTGNVESFLEIHLSLSALFPGPSWMFVACSIEISLTQATDILLMLWMCQVATTCILYTLQLLYSCGETGFSPLLFPCRILCSLSTDTVLLTGHVSIYVHLQRVSFKQHKAKFHRFHCYFQVKTKFSSLDAELHRFCFYQLQNLYKKEYTQFNSAACQIYPMCCNVMVSWCTIASFPGSWWAHWEPGNEAIVQCLGPGPGQH